jgi:hypothetical protein
MAKICRLIFSTNRLEYLVPTLSSHEQNISFGNHEVHTILIDDFPAKRYNDVFIDISQKYCINELVLHEENKGLTKTWTEAWQYISQQNFDYVWHHEDDVVFFQPIEIDTLIEFLQKNNNICQVNLKRNPWYDFEFNQPLIESRDGIFKDYRYNTEQDFFWTMSSFYPTWITKEPIVETEGCNLGEWPVMKYLKEKFNMKMAILKNQDGSPIVDHIGVYSQGKRVLENEPGWDKFKFFDPLKRYDSKNGQLIE